MKQQTVNTYIYPNMEKGYERELQRLKEWKISQNNKDAITKFHNFLASTGSGHQRITKLSSELRRIALVLDKDFSMAIKDDVQRVIAYYNQLESISEATKCDYRICMKQFYNFFEEEDLRLQSDNSKEREEAQKLYKYLRKDVKRTYKRPPSDFANVINRQEIDMILEKGCTTIKERALLQVLWESGVRASELLNMKMSDCTNDGNTWNIRVYGKTGERVIPLVDSGALLSQWLSLHPFKDNKQSLLWIGESLRYKYKPLSHRGLQKLIDRCVERAGIQKPHNCHWFRHSAASRLAPQLTEQMLCKWFGWSIGSKQVRTYCHLSGTQLRDAYLQVKGIKSKQEQQDLPIKCVCDAVNKSSSRYCYKCGKPLSVKVVFEDEKKYDDELNKTIKFFAEVMSDPVLRERFERFKKQNNDVCQT
ncbi:tyrosine-type recombinase/integrase [Candidatus Woesearchaeota archaeon]|nr:tyrosine-type recombinase/integrase [Candidatus Woesearchaeota archaeon]